MTMSHPRPVQRATSDELWAVVMESGRHSAEARARFGVRIGDLGLARQGVVLTTCQRTEVYWHGAPPTGPAEASPIFGKEAARHLFRVATGLESGVVGEDEILHQVRQSLAAARQQNLDSAVRRLFETAIATGRRARASRSSIGRSLGERALDWLAGEVDLRGGNVLIVGAGTMAAALARGAKRRGAVVVVASRTYERAQRLARKLGTFAASLEAAAARAHASAAIAVALAGYWPQLTNTPDCPVVDLSTPSAISPQVRAALAERLLDIDRLLAMTPGTNSAEAQAYSQRVEPLVAEAVAEYMSWLEGRARRAMQAAPVPA